MNLDTCTPGQRRIITTFDKPLMVSAGAGSGKTFTLTQRVAYALTDSNKQLDASFVESIEQILAITFTKKAAAELKSRIKNKLLELGLTVEALKVDDAWISTIHGMCSRILREHSLELGIDPSFEVISETDASRLMDQAFDQVIFEISESDNALLKDYIQTVGVTSYGANAGSIRDYVSTLTNRVLAVPDGFNSLELPDVEGNPAELLRQMVELGHEYIAVASTLSKPTKTDGKHLDACEAALEKAEKYLEQTVPSSFNDPSFNVSLYANVLLAFPKTSPKYRVKDSDPTFFAEYRHAYAEIVSFFEAALSAKELHFIADIAQRVYEAFQSLKGPSQLDNNDLLRLTYRALVDHPALAQAYRNQFRMIMIDEFQDTDELQVAIFSHIAKPGFSNVCTVGDAQQSIYRFRGADVSVFYAYQKELSDSDTEAEFVNLPDNFRSHADVLAFVDAVFSQPSVFGDRFLSLQPKGKVNNEPDPIFTDKPRISAALFDCSNDGPGVSGGRVACARRIAQHFAQLYDDGVSPSDMTLLLGSMSNVDVYAQALRDMGFQCLVSGGSTFSKAYEVQLIQSVLHYFDNLLDDAALYQVLSSPLFCLADETLLYLATDYDREGRAHHRTLSAGFLSWQRERGLAHLSDSQKDGMDFAYGTLNAARVAVARNGLAAGVLELFRASGWFIRLDAQKNAEAQAIVGNVYKALRMIEQIEKLGLGIERSVKQFINDCETLKLSPGTLSTTTSNFIQIMTVHSSKGLEFSHVALAEMRFCGKSENMMVENISGKTYAYIKPKALETSRTLIKALKEYLEPLEGSVEEVLHGSFLQQPRALESLIATQELAEARRLLYVALTRASKSLFVGIQYRGKKEPDYTNKGILEDLYTALRWEPSASAPVQYIDYGGSAPMLLEFNIVDANYEQTHPLESYYSFGVYSDLFNQASTAGELRDLLEHSTKDLDIDYSHISRIHERMLRVKAATENEAINGFLIPGFPPQPALFISPISRNHDEVCSYSSLGSDDNHEHSSEMFEEVYASDSKTLLNRELTEGLLINELDRNASITNENDAFFDLPEPSNNDATALGSAFHRLAQEAIECSADGVLAVPDLKDIQRQSVFYSLSAKQVARLQCALDLWFGSDCAKAFALHPFRYAEIPFMVTFGVDESQFLEGEIDGLACEFPYEEVLEQPEEKRVAYVIDYKTGGTTLESPQEIYTKHLLQAQCYAYALLKYGFTLVKAHFIRVEQEDPMHPHQPQIQKYEFETSHLHYLESTVYQRYLVKARDFKKGR